MIHEKTISFICRALSCVLRPSSSRSQENSGKSRGLPALCLGAHETTGRVRGIDAGSHHQTTGLLCIWGLRRHLLMTS